MLLINALYGAPYLRAVHDEPLNESSMALLGESGDDDEVARLQIAVRIGLSDAVESGGLRKALNEARTIKDRPQKLKPCIRSRTSSAEAQPPNRERRRSSDQKRARLWFEQEHQDGDPLQLGILADPSTSLSSTRAPCQAVSPEVSADLSTVQAPLRSNEAEEAVDAVTVKIYLAEVADNVMMKFSASSAGEIMSPCDSATNACVAAETKAVAQNSFEFYLAPLVESLAGAESPASPAASSSSPVASSKIEPMQSSTHCTVGTIQRQLSGDVSVSSESIQDTSPMPEDTSPAIAEEAPRWSAMGEPRESPIASTMIPPMARSVAFSPNVTADGARLREVQPPPWASSGHRIPREASSRAQPSAPAAPPPPKASPRRPPARPMPSGLLRRCSATAHSTVYPPNMPPVPQVLRHRTLSHAESQVLEEITPAQPSSGREARKPGSLVEGDATAIRQGGTLRPKRKRSHSKRRKKSGDAGGAGVHLPPVNKADCTLASAREHVAQLRGNVAQLQKERNDLCDWRARVATCALRYARVSDAPASRTNFATLSLN